MLNAFRHHGVLRGSLPSGLPRRLVVLNAFRHHGILPSLGNSVRTALCLRAQRLSASRSFAERNRHPRHGTHRVLNAFRHQGVFAEVESNRALRIKKMLNAFRHHGVSRTAHQPAKVNAFDVLNAFRHHRVLQDRLAQLLRAPHSMLNAFRHHGVSRLGSIRGINLPGECSTPFGITEFRGDVGSSNGCRQRVLNAFRHHGVSRQSS